jgi:hypothetical protein
MQNVLEKHDQDKVQKSQIMVTLSKKGLLIDITIRSGGKSERAYNP